MGLRRAASGNAYSLRTYSKWTEPRKPGASSSLVCLPPRATQIHPFLCVRRMRKSQEALPRPYSSQLAWNCGSPTGTLSAESMQVPCFYSRWCQPESTLWLNTSALIMFSKYSEEKNQKLTFLSAQHYASIILFILPTTTWRREYYLYFTDNKTGTERLINFPNITQLVNGRAGIWTQATWFQSPVLSYMLRGNVLPCAQKKQYNDIKRVPVST